MGVIVMPFKKLLKILFNRIFYVVLAIVIQLVWIFMMVMSLMDNSWYFSISLHVITVLAVLWIVNKNINPYYKLAWTILILVIPIFGLILYILFGKSRIAYNMEKDFKEISRENQKYLKENPLVREELETDSMSYGRQSLYIKNHSGFPLWKNTTCEYFKVGDDLFPVIIKELEKAKHFIFMEYFIINDGIFWSTILEILARKAKEGVDVRLIYDDFGCLTTLPNHYDKKLEELGIKCKVFNKFRPLLNIIQNNRDHRKLCIIDGHIGFTGGINIADEYINKKVRFGHWKDTAIMLKGDGVWNMTSMFLHMWYVITKAKEWDFCSYLPHNYHEDEFDNEGFIQPFGDSPLDHEIVGENVYLNIINRAKKYVYICTPYLIIDNEMMTALTLAAKSGVDVRIMTPGIPDKKMVFLLTQSYYKYLLEAGVKIYEYTPGFLHSKTFVCDDEVAVIGTINLDYRSLYLHFEDGVWVYKNHVVKDMRDDFVNTIDLCNRVNIEFCENRNILVRALQSIMRVFAPML